MRYNTPMRPPVDWLPVLRDALAQDGRCRLPLRGDSMTPTLPPACEIEIVPLTDAPAPGALLVFALGGGLVAHRLARRAGDRFICQGGNRRAPDPPLARGQVLGEVVGAWVDGRRVWPGRGERVTALWWLARHRAYAAARRARQFARGQARADHKYDHE